MISTTDLERAIEYVGGIQGHEPNQTNVADWLRSQGCTFPNAAFRSLWHAWLDGRSEGRRKPAKAAPAPIVAQPDPIAPKPLYGGEIASPDAKRPRLEGRRFVFTCAQNNTEVHPEFWKSLLHFCETNGAQLGVSRITYNKRGWQQHGGEAKHNPEEPDTGIWYEPKIVPYLIDHQVKVADDLVFCGELDILPTAVFPLNGFDNYTATHSAIIPHTKMQMKSLATMKHSPAKLLYTTGAVTMRNYIGRRTGQVASYHHVYGALYVEIDDDGDWFARQLNADDKGIFYDLDRVYGPGWDADASDFGQPIVNLGDVHVEKLDQEAWAGAKHMLATLQPKAVMLHDLIDFEARNHHNKKDAFFLADRWAQKKDRVVDAFKLAVEFIEELQTIAPSSAVYSIRSNHDTAFKRWLLEGTGFPDAPNLAFWHWANATMHKHIEEGNPDFDIYKWALDLQGMEITHRVHFIQEDESLVINGIEFGLHGHLGPNGARGNPSAFRQIGRRANTGHTHSAGIIDGVWTAGLLAKLDMGYNQGPSSWSQSHIITYPNGKRCIVTQRGRKWRA